MSDLQNASTNVRPTIPAWAFVAYSIAALLMAVVFIPAFAMATGLTSHVTLPGTVVAVISAGISGWAFIACPRRPFFAKAICFALFIPLAFAGLDCAVRYVMFGIK
jgi:hypothetical protein